MSHWYSLLGLPAYYKPKPGLHPFTEMGYDSCARCARCSTHFKDDPFTFLTTAVAKNVPSRSNRPPINVVGRVA